MKTDKEDKLSLNQKITSFLLAYQTTPGRPEMYACWITNGKIFCIGLEVMTVDLGKCVQKDLCLLGM